MHFENTLTLLNQMDLEIPSNEALQFIKGSMDDVLQAIEQQLEQGDPDYIARGAIDELLGVFVLDNDLSRRVFTHLINHPLVFDEDRTIIRYIHFLIANMDLEPMLIRAKEDVKSIVALLKQHNELEDLEEQDIANNMAYEAVVNAMDNFQRKVNPMDGEVTIGHEQMLTTLSDAFSNIKTSGMQIAIFTRDPMLHRNISMLVPKERSKDIYSFEGMQKIMDIIDQHFNKSLKVKSSYSPELFKPFFYRSTMRPSKKFGLGHDQLSLINQFLGEDYQKESTKKIKDELMSVELPSSIDDASLEDYCTRLDMKLEELMLPEQSMNRAATI